MKAIYFAFIIVFMCLGCSSTRHTENTLVSNENKVVERIDTIRTHDTVRVENTVRDSVVIQTRNDTVFVEKWKIRYKVRDAISKSDEVKIIRDTVTKYVTQTKTVTQTPKVSKWKTYINSFLCGIGVIALIVLAVWFVVRNKK